MTPEELAEMLFKALAQGNEALMKALARQAVRRYAGMEPGRPVGGTYYLYRTLRNLDLDNMLDKLMQQAREQAPEPLTPLEERLERDEYEARADQLRKEIEAEIRRRLVADRGVEAMAKTLRKPLPEDVDFMHASREEMASLRKAIYPLTRKLAVRLARKRRHGRKGLLDFRSTVRHSLSTGGVPIEPRFRYPGRPSPRSSWWPTSRGRWRPSPASRCTSSTPSATSSRRCGRSCSSTASTRSRGCSRASRTSASRPPGQHRGRRHLGRRPLRLRPRLRGVLVEVGQGDRPQDDRPAAGRRPEQLPRAAVVGGQGDAPPYRHVYWLNPEPKGYWDTGDSIIGDYSTHCDGVFECRNLRQLEKFVDHLV